MQLFNSNFLAEGTEVATAGFPMGVDALTAPGWLHQMGPTLQRGIVSSMLPFQGSKFTQAHGFTINVMTQGGGSGSPVFLSSSGEIVGALYAGLNDIALTEKKDIYTIPTNISYVVPSHYIAKSMGRLPSDMALPEDTVTLEDYIEQADRKNLYKESRFEVREAKQLESAERTTRMITPKTSSE